MLNLKHELDRRDLHLVVSNLPDSRFDTSVGRFLFGQLCLAAQFQADVDSERMVGITRAKHERGGHNGADPFGYRAARDDLGRVVQPHRLEVVPAEADLVRLVFDRYGAGDVSQGRLAEELRAEGLKPAIIDFEGRPDEWGSRTRSLGIDMDLVLYINRDRMPLDIRGLSILDKSVADYVASEMKRHAVDVYFLDNLITALLVGEEQMKSDALLPWQYRDVVQGWSVPGASAAHPPRGRTDGDPYGSVMWSAASRLLWHGNAASGASRGEHHTRWRLHKANTKRKPDPFLLVTTFDQSGDEVPTDIEYRIDTLSTRDWLVSAMGTQEWTVEDLTELMLESEDSVTAAKVEQAKERIRKALNTGEKQGDFANTGQRGRGRAGKWCISVTRTSSG